MPYLYIVIAIIVLFVVMHKFTELQMQEKAVITVVMALIVGALYFFEQANIKSAKQVQDLRFAFEQGQTLVCKDKEVTRDFYNYASRSFVGKKGTKMFGSQNIAIGDCKIKP